MKNLRFSALFAAAIVVSAVMHAPAAESAEKICPQITTPTDTAVSWWPTASEWQSARATTAKMSDDKLARSSLIVTYAGTTTKYSRAQKASNKKHLGKEKTLPALEAFQPSGVVLFPGNASSAKQAFSEKRNLATVLPPWMVISVDQEGGPVSRLTGDIEPPVAAPKVGDRDSIEKSTQVAMHAGRQLRAAGVNWTLAPVLDVESKTSSRALAGRMFSTNAQKVGELASAQIIQYNLEGVTPVIKHFPGLGSIKNDTHTAISKYPHSLSRLCKIDLKPFRLAITAGATALMVGHGVYPSLGEAAASGNARILKDLLRTEMRYEGIIVTDSMSMDGATAGLQRSQNLYVRSLKAGVDVILMPGNPTIALQGIKKALETGKLSRAERRESIARLIAFRLAQQRVADTAQKFPAGSNFLVTEAQWFALDF